MGAQGPAVIVTGAASGMGWATAELLAEGGWSVVAADTSADRLAELDERPNLRTAVADVSVEGDNAKLVDIAVERFGRLDGLVLNAGVAFASPLEALDRDVVAKHLDVNLYGPLFGIKAALPYLRKAQNPSVVVVASTNGLGGDNSMGAYAASKSAVVGLVRSLAREVGYEGIRVNAVCPGATHTGMTAGLQETNPAKYQQVADWIPLGRWAEPVEIAAVIQFLLSPQSSYVNGVALPVDGGAMAGVGLHPPARATSDLRTYAYSDRTN